jgi:hypothetical protein
MNIKIQSVIFYVTIYFISISANEQPEEQPYIKISDTQKFKLADWIIKTLR